jgi:hypothetical protein
MRTLCFDVENVFVRRVNIMDDEQLQELQQSVDFHDYIIYCCGQDGDEEDK